MFFSQAREQVRSLLNWLVPDMLLYSHVFDAQFSGIVCCDGQQWRLYNSHRFSWGCCALGMPHLDYFYLHWGFITNTNWWSFIWITYGFSSRNNYVVCSISFAKYDVQLALFATSVLQHAVLMEIAFSSSNHVVLLVLHFVNGVFVFF